MHNTQGHLNDSQNRKETHSLIASDKVEGTAVRRPDGDKLGSIERIMIDKRSGRVAYAVMSFGGFMGIGHDHYALPWSLLRYNESIDAYELNVTEDQLKGAPAHSRGDSFETNDRTRDEEIYRYYGASPYWGAM